MVQNQIRLWEAPNLFSQSSVRIVRGYKEKREKEWYNKSGNWLLFSTEWRIQWMWQYLYTQDLSILYLQIHVWGQKLLLHCKKFTIHILYRLDSEQKTCECDVNAWKHITIKRAQAYIYVYIHYIYIYIYVYLYIWSLMLLQC